MTRTSFNEKLSQLKADLLVMGGLAEQSISRAVHALLTGDKNLAEEVIRGDEKINEKEEYIANECAVLLATEQPVAGDLRFIISTLNTIRDLERIGDYAVHLAKTVFYLPDSSIPFQTGIQNITDYSILMLRDVLKAWADQNGDLALKTNSKDKVVDSLYLRLFRDMLEKAKEGPWQSEQMIHLLLAIKYIERLADHIVNICEEIEYMCIGKRKDFGTH
jgi:phosphate transport system protein